MNAPQSKPSQALELAVYPDHVVVILKPAVVDTAWGQIESFGDEVIAEIDKERSPCCLIDLTGLTYMGSSQVALIVRIWKAVQQKKGSMRVVVDHPVVKEVITIAGLDKVWHLSVSVAAARSDLFLKTPPDDPQASPQSTPNLWWVLMILLLLGISAALLIFFNDPS